MIHVNVPQGGAAWIQARLGLPTASCFDRLITPKTMKPSASTEPYLDQLLAEWLIGEPLDPDLLGFMERGRELEDDAVRFYEGLRDVETTACGFCLTDDRRAGASPDRLVGEDGGLELKCPGAAAHVGFIRHLREPKPTKYYAQIQGGLWVTGRQWWDFMSYHPTIPPVVVRYPRDEAFIATLAAIVAAFCDKLDAERAEFLAAGYAPALEAV